jgi:hypothetical protein
MPGVYGSGGGGSHSLTIMSFIKGATTHYHPATTPNNDNYAITRTTTTCFFISYFYGILHDINFNFH